MGRGLLLVVVVLVFVAFKQEGLKGGWGQREGDGEGEGERCCDLFSMGGTGGGGEG